jgi:DNA-binding CsgD family transcriptional regulator
MIVDTDDLITKFEFLKYMPGYITVQDINSKLCGAGLSPLRLTGWNNINQLIGKSYYDIPCPISEAAELLIKIDRMAITTKKPVISINVFQDIFGIKAMLNQRKSLKTSEGNIIGVMGQSIDATNLFINNLSWLTNADTRFIDIIKTPQQYILTSETCPLPLSQREQECLALLIRGRVMKEIAFILGINARTVETHIANIKAKLGCTSKSQLIEKAINSGFLFHIPHSLLG